MFMQLMTLKKHSALKISNAFLFFLCLIFKKIFISLDNLKYRYIKLNDMKDDVQINGKENISYKEFLKGVPDNLHASGTSAYPYRACFYCRWCCCCIASGVFAIVCRIVQLAKQVKLLGMINMPDSFLLV